MIFQLFAWSLIPLIPALIALYFLKLKRQEKVISSTFLWARSLEDLHVNAPFQRMRRSLLLLLQLLILAALIAAASKPIIESEVEIGVSRIILLDVSASMNVEESGGTRLELAREKALKIIESMQPTDLTGLITFAARPKVLQPLTTDKAKLTRAVGAVEGTSLPTDFTQALKTAASLSEASTGSEIYVVSDASFGAVKGIPAELERLDLKFIPVGEKTENVGIIELDVRRDFGKEKRTEVFGSVLNAGTEPVSVTLSFFEGDVLRDAVELEIAPGKTRGRVFDGTEYVGKVLRLEVEPGGALGVDDRAWIRIDPPEPVDVLMVGDGNYYLENVLKVDPMIRARRVSLGAYTRLRREGRLEDDPADVFLFDAACPETLPDRPSIYVGCLPPFPELTEEAGDKPDGAGTEGAADGEAGDGKAGAADDANEIGANEIGADEARKAAPGETVENPIIVTYDEGHPANRFISFADLFVAESIRLPEGGRFRSILDSSKGSLAATLTLTPPGQPAVELLLLGFDIRNSNWPLLHSFVMFFSNAISWLGEGAGRAAAHRYRTGEMLVYRGESGGESGDESDDGGDTLVVRDPTGRESPLVEQATGELIYAGTTQTGVYELRRAGAEGDEVILRFPVSLLNRKESRIAPSDTLKVGASAQAQAQAVPENRDLWKWFALVSLAVLLVEWWMYNRRMTL